MSKTAWAILIAIAVLTLGGGASLIDSGSNAVVSKLADAIEYAEGFFVSGSRPQRNNNPGDLETDITGAGIGFDGPYVVYPTYQAGRAALEQLIRLMFSGSHIYKPSMTIAEVASHYTATQQDAWASTVAAHYGVSVNTRLEDLVA